jgi:hypothetical protein
MPDDVAVTPTEPAQPGFPVPLGYPALYAPGYPAPATTGYPAPLPGGYYPAPPGGFGTPPVPRRRRRGLIIGVAAAVVLVLVLVLGGAAFVVFSNRHHKPQGPAAVGDGTALLAEMVPAPAGSTPVTGGGVKDLATFVDEHFPTENVAATNELRSYGFAVAAERAYTRTDQVIVATQLVQFGTSNGAASYVRQQRAAFLADPAVTDPTPVTQVAGGASFEFGKIDATHPERHAVLIGDAGNVAVVMFIYSPGVLDRYANVTVFVVQVQALPTAA